MATTGTGKAYLIAIRFLAIASFATSIFACFSAHYSVTINEHPYVEHLFDIQCEDLPSGNGRNYCETSVNARYYGLWRAFDNFFSMEDWDGGVLCGSRDFEVPVTGDIATLTVGDLGQCSESLAKVVQSFTICATLFAAFLVIFITIFAEDDVLGSNDAGKFHTRAAALQGMTVVSSAIALATYLLGMHPLRLDEQFCDRQTLFDHCEEKTGAGVWFQAVTLIMSFLGLLIGFGWKLFGAPTESEEVSEQPARADAHEEGPFYLHLHFYVMVVRFTELAILFVAVVAPFARVHTTLPANLSSSDADILSHAFDGKGGSMDTEINLWQGLFCHPFGARLFLWSVVLDELGEVEMESNFGECTHKHLFHVQMGCIMATVTAITSLALQKDAKTMPLPFLVGFIMHFASLIKISWALAAFLLEVFPGRGEIDPSYCSLWGSYVKGGTCSIDVGPGVSLLWVALASVALSFIGEITILRTKEYGVGTAFTTVLTRVRQGRLADLGKD